MKVSRLSDEQDLERISELLVPDAELESVCVVELDDVRDSKVSVSDFEILDDERESVVLDSDKTAAGRF